MSYETVTVELFTVNMTNLEGVRESSVEHQDGKELERRKKKKLIQNALKKNDDTTLRQLAISKYGLVSDSIRRKVWPKILKIEVMESSPKPDLKTIQNHQYYNQVVLDVNRALRRFPPSIEEQQRMAMQDQLIFLIVRVLMKHPQLHYYQGYHDICVTFLLVLGEEVAFSVVEKLSVLHLKEFMEETMENTSNLLHYIYLIIGQENMELRSYIEKSDVGVIFCLSWVITWFGHVLENYSNVVRLYDFFLACQPLMPVYLSAAILLHRQEDIMNTECDMAIMHNVLQQISDDLPFEKLVDIASQLYISHPPEALATEYNQIIELKAQLLKEEKERREQFRKQWNRKNKSVLVVTYRAMHSWLFSNQRVNTLGRWTVTFATGATVAVAAYAILHNYLHLSPAQISAP